MFHVQESQIVLKYQLKKKNTFLENYAVESTFRN